MQSIEPDLSLPSMGYFNMKHMQEDDTLIKPLAYLHVDNFALLLSYTFTNCKIFHNDDDDDNNHSDYDHNHDVMKKLAPTD